MINILQIVPVLSYGGVERVVRNYYSALDHKEFHFDYVSHGEFVDYNQTLMDEGSQIFFLPTIGKAGMSGYKKEIAKKINIKKYDVVHIHTGDITGLYAKAYRQMGAKKIICHAHTAHPVSSLAKIAKIYFRHLALKYSDYRLACGILAGNYCFGKKNYILLPNSINYRKFIDVTEDQKKELKKELCLPDDKYILGHVGSFCSQKNHDFLIDVFNDLLKNHDNYILVLVGDGPDVEKIKEKVHLLKIEEKIRFLGNRNDVNVLMNIFDLFIFPSHFEGLPVVGVEAQAAGIKCLLSDQIDKTVDLQIGLVDFLPIYSGTTKWVDSIENFFFKKQNLPGKDEIVHAIIEKGYDTNKSVENLSKIYMSL